MHLFIAITGVYWCQQGEDIEFKSTMVWSNQVQQRRGHLVPFIIFLCWIYCACVCVCLCVHAYECMWAMINFVKQMDVQYRPELSTGTQCLQCFIMKYSITIFGVLIEQVVIVSASSILLITKTCVVWLFPITLWGKSPCRKIPHNTSSLFMRP